MPDKAGSVEMSRNGGKLFQDSVPNPLVLTFAPRFVGCGVEHSKQKYKGCSGKLDSSGVRCASSKAPLDEARPSGGAITAGKRCPGTHAPRRGRDV